MCSICDGSGMSHRCPVCSDDYDYEPLYAECPNCCDDKYFYRIADGEMITREEYDMLSENTFPTCHTCPQCGGEGQIIVDHDQRHNYCFNNDEY